MRKYISHKGRLYRSIDSSSGVVTDFNIAVGESQTSLGGGSNEYRADISGKLDGQYFSFRATATRSGKIKTPPFLYDIRGVDQKIAKTILKKSNGRSDFTI